MSVKLILVIESLATVACTVAGVHFWRSGPGSSRSWLGSREIAAQSKVDASDPVHAVAVDRRHAEPTPRRDDRSSAAEDSRETPPATDSLAGVAAPARVQRRPQAPPSSIAPLPEFAPSQSAAPRIPESLARAALRFVGKDPAAEEMWAEAINQPDLSSEARSDLIEDLNDEGYPDPNHYTSADLPLILERLRIVERHAPHAMDDVNAAAFQEAYKDLLEMLIRLRGASSR